MNLQWQRNVGWGKGWGTWTPSRYFPRRKFLRFEVLAVVVSRNIIFWDITSCRLFKVNLLSGGIYRLYLQGRRIRGVRNQSENRFFSRGLFFTCRYVLPKRLLTFNGLHGAIFQKTVPFITREFAQKLMFEPFKCKFTEHPIVFMIEYIFNF
jgi:hypothetical protein